MMELLDDGGYSISDKIDIPGEGISNFVFGRGWLVELIHLDEGDYSFFSDGTEVRPTSARFGVLYPRFSFVRCYARDIKGSVRGIGAVRSFPQLPVAPMIFETDFEGEFTDTAQALDVLNSATNRRSIEINTTPSLLSLKAKRLVDDNYLFHPLMSRIAARLKVSPEHLSRQFKRDYGLSPSAYLHQLCVSEATFRLSLGEEIIDVSGEVGYNDLSRFYKQFRKATRTSPAVCRTMLKK